MKIKRRNKAPSNSVGREEGKKEEEEARRRPRDGMRDVVIGPRAKLNFVPVSLASVAVYLSAQ